MPLSRGSSASIRSRVAITMRPSAIWPDFLHCRADHAERLLSELAVRGEIIGIVPIERSISSSGTKRSMSIVLVLSSFTDLIFLVGQKNVFALETS